MTLWLSAEAMDAWRPAPSGRPGGPRKFSDVSIMTALMLRLVFRLPLRQTEGFLRSVLALMRTDLEAPDHTTLSRRSQHLDLALDRIPAQRPVHLIVDSTGLSIVGEGEWAAVQHGTRGTRGWKKLHFGVDRSGVIVAQAVTEPTADDATTGISLIEQVDGDIASVTADAAYDTIAFYEAACARGARVVVPPAKTASVSRRRPRSGARDRTITRVKRLGRRRWKKASGYQRQARVENAVFRYKSIIGDGLRARTPGGRQTETLLACNVLNRMTELGRPASLQQRSLRSAFIGSLRLNGSCCNNASRRPRVRRARPPRTESPGARQSPEPAAVDGTATPGVASRAASGIAVEIQAPNGVGRCRMLPLADASAASLHPFVTDHVAPRATGSVPRSRLCWSRTANRR